MTCLNDMCGKATATAGDDPFLWSINDADTEHGIGNLVSPPDRVVNPVSHSRRGRGRR